MKRWVNILSQISLGVGQIYTLWEPHLTQESKFYFVIGIAVGQLAISAIAHEFNPDGTPAEVSYHKKEN